MGDYDWLKKLAKPALQYAGNQYQSSNANNTQEDIFEIMRQQEDANYQNALAQHQANLASSNAARGAARQTDSNRRNALGNAQKILEKSHKQSMRMLRPYAQAGRKMLPFHTNTAQGGLKGMDMLAAYMQSQPMRQAPQALSEINVGALPASLFGGK